MKVNAITLNINHLNKTWAITEHLKKYKLYTYSDTNFFLSHFYNNSSKKVIIYLQHKKIYECIKLNSHSVEPGGIFSNSFSCNSLSWIYRLFQQQKNDLIDIMFNDLEIVDLINLIKKIIKNNYTEFLFLFPADSNEDGNLIISALQEQFDNCNIILYSMEHKFNIPNQNLTPLKEQLDNILGYSIYDSPNEFFNLYFTTMAHWIWNYNLNKNQKWLITN